jgi:hypothetical protein
MPSISSLEVIVLSNDGEGSSSSRPVASGVL